MKLHNKEKIMVTRKYIVVNLLLMGVIGLMFVPVLVGAFERAKMATFSNVSICLIIYACLCLFFWLPLAIPMNQIAEVDDSTLSIMPRYSSFKKVQIAWYVLVTNNPKPFYRVLHINDIHRVTFTFESHWGAYAFQRFTFILKLRLQDETVKIYLNPQQNGPLLPSGYGNPFIGTYSKEDMVNLIEHFRTLGVDVNDPYMLLNALKDENVVLYDYLVSLKKKITF